MVGVVADPGIAPVGQQLPRRVLQRDELVASSYRGSIEVKRSVDGWLLYSVKCPLST